MDSTVCWLVKMTSKIAHLSVGKTGFYTRNSQVQLISAFQQSLLTCWADCRFLSHCHLFRIGNTHFCTLSFPDTCYRYSPSVLPRIVYFHANWNLRAKLISVFIPSFLRNYSIVQSKVLFSFNKYTDEANVIAGNMYKKTEFCFMKRPN